MQGVVVKNTGSIYHVRTLTGEVVPCRIRGNFRLQDMKTTNPVAIGDRVEFIKEERENAGLLTTIFDRKNCIIRKSVKLSKQKHIIAANVDRAFLVVSLIKPRTPQGFIDRFLVTAEAYHVEPILVFNKTDIYAQEETALLSLYKDIYGSIGYTCLETSALEKTGLDALKALLQDKVSLFIGNSGVGKSALINAIDPTIHIKTGNISNYHQKGTHTTTFAEMHPLFFGGYLIDSPGIKEFGMVNFNTEEISLYFPEIRNIKADCQFSNCSHIHEPHCAVKKALEEKKIHPLRYKGYLAILNGEEVEEPSLLENKKMKK